LGSVTSFKQQVAFALIVYYIVFNA